jgi:hypothetical protein
VDEGDADLIGSDDHRGESTETQLAVMQAKVKLLSWYVRHELVHKHEFGPVKMLVYGITALIMSAVFVAVLSLVVNKS